MSQDHDLGQDQRGVHGQISGKLRNIRRSWQTRLPQEKPDHDFSRNFSNGSQQRQQGQTDKEHSLHRRTRIHSQIRVLSPSSAIATCSGALVVSNSWDPMGCSLPGSSVHGIIPARILEWVAISFSMQLPQEHKNHDLRSHLCQGQGEWWKNKQLLKSHKLKGNTWSQNTMINP